MASASVAYLEPEYCISAQVPRIEGHWEPVGREPEEGPGWDSHDDAIQWGRGRAPEVYFRIDSRIDVYRYVRAGDLLVRLHSPTEASSVFYTAGDVPPTTRSIQRDDDVSLKSWPHRSSGRTLNKRSDYGGAVFLSQRAERPEFGELVGFTLRREVLHNSGLALAEVNGPGWKDELDVLVALAREGSRYVIVTSGPPDYEYWSAGEDPLPDLGLPMWDETGRPNHQTSANIGTDGEEQVGVRVSVLRSGKQFPT